jgi:hypothetical protein
MKCPLSFDTILSYVLGDLDEDEARGVRQHVASCQRCEREIEAIRSLSGGLAALPRVQADDRLWHAVRSAAEGEAAGPVGLVAGVLNLLRRPVVVGIGLAAAACGIILLRSGERAVSPPGASVGMVEMGSKYARTRFPNEDIQSATASYIGDVRLIIADTMSCADSGDANRWSALKDRIASSDMLYRALCLRARLEGAAKTGRPEASALIDDSITVLRHISEQSPEALAAGGDTIEKELARMDLLGRLQREGER